MGNEDHLLLIELMIGRIDILGIQIPAERSCLVSCQQFYQWHRRRSLSFSLHLSPSVASQLVAPHHINDLDAHLFIYSKQGVVGYLMLRSWYVVWRASLNWEQLTDKWAVAPKSQTFQPGSHMRRPGGESLSFFLPSAFVLIEFIMHVTDQLIVTKEFRSSMYVCVHENERETG